MNTLSTRKSIKKSLFKNGLNKVNQYLTISDLIIIGATGLISPFIPLFISTEVSDGSLVKAGFAMTLALVVKAILQVPISRYVDNKKGELDDYQFLLVGSILVALSYFAYAFVGNMTQLYLIQIFQGIGAAASSPTWYAIFSRHVDKSKEAFQWTVYDTSISIGTALTASLGGVLITVYDYRKVFLVVAGFILLGSLFIISIRNSLNRK